jgi:hypothetical protein
MRAEFARVIIRERTTPVCRQRVLRAARAAGRVRPALPVGRDVADTARHGLDEIVTSGSVR